jgi:hypothetical protein
VGSLLSFRCVGQIVHILHASLVGFVKQSLYFVVLSIDLSTTAVCQLSLSSLFFGYPSVGFVFVENR